MAGESQGCRAELILVQLLLSLVCCAGLQRARVCVCVPLPLPLISLKDDPGFDS